MEGGSRKATKVLSEAWFVYVVAMLFVWQSNEASWDGKLLLVGLTLVGGILLVALTLPLPSIEPPRRRALGIGAGSGFLLGALLAPWTLPGTGGDMVPFARVLANAVMATPVGLVGALVGATCGHFLARAWGAWATWALCGVVLVILGLGPWIAKAS